MNYKRLLFIAFILVALAQLFIPIQMISKQAENALGGREFLFKIGHEQRGENFHNNNFIGNSIKGKFIWFHFDIDKMKEVDKKVWDMKQNFYVTLTEDSLGLAKIQSITQSQPDNSSDWVKVDAFWSRRDSSAIQLTFPFNKYYIKDSNTKDIEKPLLKILNDSMKVIYMKVKINKDQFVVKDLTIDGVPFEIYARSLRDSPAK